MERSGGGFPRCRVRYHHLGSICRFLLMSSALLKCRQAVTLICISVIINEVGHLFLGLLPENQAQVELRAGAGTTDLFLPFLEAGDPR